jgi:cation transport protein ChaC
MVLALTSELVAKAHREVADSGPSAGVTYLQDDDFRLWIDHVLEGWDQDAGFWVFAYGSLIWKPEFVPVEERLAYAPGWHRAFALKLTRWRGTPERPGLMMALDRGGSCRGIAYRLQEDDLRETLGQLFRREMSANPPSNVPRWVRLNTSQGYLQALAFTVSRTAPAYAGRLPDEEVVEALATAVGHWGSCAEYLHNTVTHLEAKGIRDRRLWSLQAQVAERLAGMNGASDVTPR